MRVRNLHRQIRPIVLLAVLSSTGVVRAESVHELVSQGNAAFAQERYEKALELYGKAGEAEPEAAQVWFNRGTVYYKQESFEEAVDEFRTASLKTEDPSLIAKARYNVGNCYFRMAEMAEEDGPEKQLERCRQAVAAYREARKFDPAYREAAENIEIVRRYMKKLQDQLEEQGEQEEENSDENQEEDLVSKLKKLLQRQEALRQENYDLEDVRRTDGELWRRAIRELGDRQNVLRDDTGAVLEELRATKSQVEQQAAQENTVPDNSKPGAPAPSAAEMAAKLAEAEGHVVTATVNQKGAADQLGAMAQISAGRNQDQAVLSLQQAIEALADPNQEQNQDNEQSQDGDQNQDQNQEDGESQDSGENQEQRNQDGAGDQEERPQDGDAESNNPEGEEGMPEENGAEQDGEGDPQDGEENPAESEREAREGTEGEESEEERQARIRKELLEQIMKDAKKNQKRFRVRPVPARPVDRDW